VVRLVGGCEHLGLVDVIHAKRLEDLRFGEVADAGLGHDRDRHRGLDALDHLRIAHAGDATITANVGRYPLEGHDGRRTRVFGDLGLVGRDHIHDHAALEHLREAPLHSERPGLVRLTHHLAILKVALSHSAQY